MKAFRLLRHYQMTPLLPTALRRFSFSHYDSPDVSISPCAAAALFATLCSDFAVSLPPADCRLFHAAVSPERVKEAGAGKAKKR